MTSFKPGFLNPQTLAPQPRRIQIKEDSEESEQEDGKEPVSEAVLSQVSAHTPASDFVHPMKPSQATIAAAAAAAVAVTDADIVARAARIASMNVTES
jgi:hypothetical protein